MLIFIGEYVWNRVCEWVCEHRRMRSRIWNGEDLDHIFVDLYGGMYVSVTYCVGRLLWVAIKKGVSEELLFFYVKLLELLAIPWWLTNSTP